MLLGGVLDHCVIRERPDDRFRAADVRLHTLGVRLALAAALGADERCFGVQSLVEEL